MWGVGWEWAGRGGVELGWGHSLASSVNAAGGWPIYDIPLVGDRSIDRQKEKE